MSSTMQVTRATMLQCIHCQNTYRTENKADRWDEKHVWSEWQKQQIMIEYAYLFIYALCQTPATRRSCSQFERATEVIQKERDGYKQRKIYTHTKQKNCLYCNDNLKKWIWNFFCSYFKSFARPRSIISHGQRIEIEFLTTKKTNAHTFMSQSKHCNICSAIFFGTNYRWWDKHFNIIWLWIIEYNLSCGQVLARNSNEEIIPFWSVFFGCFVPNIKVHLCVSINKTFNCNDLINLLTWTFWLVLLNIQMILKLKWHFKWA